MSDKTWADPMDDLYASKSEAYFAGKHSGSAEAISWARVVLTALSVKYESADDPTKFRAVEECCALLRKFAEMIELERQRSKDGQH